MTNPSSPLRFGIVGAANIARQFTAALKESTGVRVDAVASRSDATARAFAEANAIPRAFPSYEALLVDADIDAVYIPLPNHLHAEWVIKAANAGMTVICTLHSNSERAVLKRLAQRLAEALPAVRFQQSQSDRDPFVVQ